MSNFKEFKKNVWVNMQLVSEVELQGSCGVYYVILSYFVNDKPASFSDMFEDKGDAEMHLMYLIGAGHE